MDESKVIKVDVLVCGSVLCRGYAMCGDPDGFAAIGNAVVVDNEPSPDEIKVYGITYDCRNAIVIRTRGGVGTVDVSAMQLPRGKVLLATGRITCYADGIGNDDTQIVGIL